MAETFDWTSALSNATALSTPANIPEGFSTIGNPHFINSVAKYEWMVVVTLILAFLMAWGIGANDVANAFATSVGAGSITLPVACGIAAVMEFGGALLLGGAVTDTVRKKVINVDIFDPNQPEGAANGPEMLMTGFLLALIAATFWLVTATYFALPVSTTHSIIGALIGVGLAYRGSDAVVWMSSGTGFKRLKGVVGVVISWVVSPVLSGIIAVIFFLIVRTTVLRRADPFKNGLIFMPFFYGITLSMAVFFIVYKGDKRFDLSEKLGTGGALGVAFGAGAVLAAFTAVVITPLAKKSVEKWEQRELEKEKNPDGAKEEKTKGKGVADALSKVGVHLSIEEELEEDVVRMHDNVEKFDPKTERLFTWVQVFTAAVDAFAHGANDVANAIAPFSSVFQLHKNGGVITARTKSPKFSEAANLDGVAYEEGDEIPTHKTYCGRLNDVDYFKCADEPVFPFTAPGPGTPQQLPKYFDNETNTGETGLCYPGSCYPRNYSSYKSQKQDVELWILALGGVGIVVGLAMWGYRIILAIGVKLTKLTPSRGFSIEIGAAITVLIASEIGLPVSTTHCQVGATMGVGLVEGKASTVNWKQFLMICAGWVFTVVFTGLLSSILYLVVTSSPTNMEVPQGNVLSESNNTLDFCPGNRVFVYNEVSKNFAGVYCSGQSPGSTPQFPSVEINPL